MLLSICKIIFLLSGGLIVAESLKANELLLLGGLSLFMTAAERNDIDDKSLVTELPTDPVAVVDKPIRKQSFVREISLSGAVIRPDHSAVLMLSTGTKVIKGKTPPPAPNFRFEVEAYHRLVQISPGETVNVRTSHAD